VKSLLIDGAYHRLLLHHQDARYPIGISSILELIGDARLNERVPVESGLTRAEILSGPFEDICEIEFCRSAEANAPFPLDHEAYYSAVLEMTFSDRSFK
jgi:hypothetical protein